MSAPTPGRIVHFRSRTGKYTVPAIINATMGTLNPDGVALGHVPVLTDPTSVHLTVLTPGIPPAGVGSRANAPDFIAPSRAKRMAQPLHAPMHLAPVPVGENLGGTYQEWDVPQWTPGEGSLVTTTGIYEDQPAGTWTWPPRVDEPRKEQPNPEWAASIDPRPGTVWTGDPERPKPELVGPWSDEALFQALGALRPGIGEQPLQVRVNITVTLAPQRPFSINDLDLPGPSTPGA